jgi:hypothetical protein
MSNTTATRPDDWPNWGDTGDKTRPPTDAYIAAGWPQSTTAPPRQYWNWAFNQCFDGIRYVLQRGIGAWSGTETYNTNAIVERAGLQYRALLASGPGSPQDPTTATTYWELLTLSAAQITAAGFDAITARNAAITAQQGVQDARTTSAINAALTPYVTNSAMLAAVYAAVGAANPALLPPSSLGVFGTGRYQVILTTQAVTIPAGVSSIRVREVGGGGGGGTGITGASGSGAGYAHGVFAVTPGDIHSVTIGAAGSSVGPTAGGMTSFGILLSASGGGANGAPAGTGSGGDFQAAGGLGTTCSGGGAAGSQRGKGGSSAASSASGPPVGGAAVGGVGALFSTAVGSGGASPFSVAHRAGDGAPDMYGNVARYGSTTPGADGAVNVGFLPIRFPFDGFTGGGGASAGATSGFTGGRGGPGAGGGAGNTLIGGTGGDGGDGGGGGAGNTIGAGAAGNGGFGAGGGWNLSGGSGNGGQGFVVMEY